MPDRIDQVRALLPVREVDAVLLSCLPDIRWACGFTGSNGLLLVRPDAAHFVTDGRYTEQARAEVQGAEIHVPGYNLIEHLAEGCLLDGAHTVLFQSDHVTVAQLDQWQDELEDVSWTGASGLLREHVAAKDDEEVERLRRAQRVTAGVFEHLFGWIMPGMTEREVGAEIVYQHLRRGVDAMAFPPIVASGPNGALPHARPTDRRLREGDLVVIDIGAYLDGYASDMTRTVALGEPADEARVVYDVVRRAQEAAVRAARAGLQSDQLDAVARDVIEEAGFEDAFPHSLGHGLGLQVHEWPSVSHRYEYELPLRSVITIEPGVYLEGRFGVRIEDVVVLREDGCESLTGVTKDLVIL